MKLKKGLTDWGIISITLLFVLFILASCNTKQSDDQKLVKLKPVISGEWWMIGPKPDLEDQLPLLNIDYKGPLAEVSNQPNDHHIFQSPDGKWHLWACVRNTKVGRLLMHWQADDLCNSPWLPQNDFIRANRNAGESIVDWHGQEFLQSPFIVEEDDKFYMFYGGYDTGVDSDGDSTTNYGAQEKQISLMTSTDGYNWERHKNADGFSRVMVGPGATRDQYLVKFGVLWYIYYTGHLNRDTNQECILVRTSKDLINWSDWKVAHYVDSEYQNRKTNESPTVVKRGGYYYMFRSGGYTGDGNGSTAVFRSSDPLDFGTLGDGKEKYVCNIAAHAPEIVFDNDGNEYISKIHSEEHGYAIQLARLKWEKEAK